MSYYIGIDIGGTNIKYGLINEKGETVVSDKVPTKDDKDEIVATLKNIADKYRSDYEIELVGISIPGVVDEKGFLVTGGALHSLYNVAFQDLIREELVLPAFVENDANCALLAEKWIGAAKDSSNVLVMVIGTGIGGAVLINGQIYKGAQNMAGEFGFMMVDEIVNGDGRGAALSQLAGLAEGITQRYNNRTGSALREAKEIFDRYDTDDNAKAVLDNFYHFLSIGIYNLSIMYDPERFLIGGAVSANAAFMERLVKEVKGIKNSHGDMSGLKLPDIVKCELGNHAGMTGAVYNGIIKSHARNA